MADAVRGKHNLRRRTRMRSRSLAELKVIAEGGTLSAAAAIYELMERTAK